MEDMRQQQMIDSLMGTCGDVRGMIMNYSRDSAMDIIHRQIRMIYRDDWMVTSVRLHVSRCVNKRLIFCLRDECKGLCTITEDDDEVCLDCGKDRNCWMTYYD